MSGDESKRGGAGRTAPRVLQDMLPMELTSGESIKWPSRIIWGGISTRTAHRGARRLCDICTEVIHELGQAVAPVPRPAQLKRRGPNGDTYLCSGHGMDMREQDRRVTEKYRHAVDKSAR